MSLFTSARERRLWLWLLALMVVIYSTLGTQGILVEALRERNLLRVSIYLVMLVVVGSFVAYTAKRHPGRREIWVALGVMGAYLWAFTRMQSLEERTHLLEYGVVAVLIHEALLERRRNGRRVPVPAVLAVVVTALLGWLDEGIQALLPNRVYDLRDVGFNALAGLMVIAARLALARVRRRRPSRR